MIGLSADGGDHGGSAGDDGDSPLEAVAAGVVTTLTLGVAFGLLALGQPYFWVAFPIGFGGGMPLAIGLARLYASTTESREPDRGERSETDTALRDLRNRNARGELDDEEFENRVERLLETESVSDAKAFTERGATDGEAGNGVRESEPAAETAGDDGER